MGGTFDESTGLAYFGTGNPAPWNSHLRPGDNLSHVAIKQIATALGMPPEELLRQAR